MPKKRERPLLQHMEVGDNTPAYHPAPDGDSPDRPTVVPTAGAPRYTPPTNSCGDPFPRLSPEGASKGQDHSPPGDSKPTSPTSPTVPSVAVKQPIRGLPTIGKDSSETSLLVPDSSIITDEGSQVETAVIDPEEIGHMTLWNGQRIKVDEFIKREKNKHEMYRPISDLYCCLRMWSFVGHFGVLVCLPVLLWLVFTRAGRKLEESVEDHLTHKLWFTTPVALTAIFMGLSYLLILCEVCISRTRPYIANLMHIDEARLYVRDMRKVAPRILLKVTCYHYADNNRGKTYKKVTYEDKQEFRFSYCQDASGTLRREDFEEGMATKVKMRRVFGFLDEDTEQRYKTFKNNLIAKHTPKDFYIDIEEIVEIDGLRDKISVYPEEDSRPNCMQYKYYWISAICFLTLPYRYWFNRHTRKSSFTFIKLIKG